MKLHIIKALLIHNNILKYPGEHAPIPPSCQKVTIHRIILPKVSPHAQQYLPKAVNGVFCEHIVHFTNAPPANTPKDFVNNFFSAL